MKSPLLSLACAITLVMSFSPVLAENRMECQADIGATVRIEEEDIALVVTLEEISDVSSMRLSSLLFQESNDGKNLLIKSSDQEIVSLGEELTIAIELPDGTVFYYVAIIGTQLTIRGKNCQVLRE